MRAMENNLVVKVGLSDSTPLGVDTKEDLKKVTKFYLRIWKYFQTC
jgi:CMP-2-keto-3-deoxyoctulosonic acid synthetase